MAKREKIILLIMSVVVAFGLYDFFFSSGAKKKPAAPVNTVAETTKFIADVANSLKVDSTETDMYIVRRARAEWGRDPFWHMDRRAEAKAEAPVAANRPKDKTPQDRVYSGYLEMGGQRLAIIDGAEYGPGDELGRGGPVIKSIDPRQVVLADPKTAGEIILPLKETR